MSQHTPVADPATATKASGLRRRLSGVGYTTYAVVALWFVVIAATCAYYGYFSGTRYAGEDHPIGQQYGVEVIGFDQDAEPERITVKEPGKEAVTCLLPTIRELENREPLRGCIPQPPPGTTIPAKQASTK